MSTTRIRKTRIEQTTISIAEMVMPHRLSHCGSGQARGRSRSKTHGFGWLISSGNGLSLLRRWHDCEAFVWCEYIHTISTSNMSKVRSSPVKGRLASIMADCSETFNTARYADRLSVSMACNLCPTVGCRSAARAS